MKYESVGSFIRQKTNQRFYVPPKIRKAVTILTVTNKILLPKRPIISDCNSEFEKVTDFIESF